jgi:hypothetical protein
MRDFDFNDIGPGYVPKKVKPAATPYQPGDDRPDLPDESDYADLQALTRRNDPQTSKDAAEEVNASGSTGRRVEEILAILRQHPAGLIGIEIAHKLNVEVAWISSLLTRMERNGLLQHNGKRENPESGKKQTVWQAI